jgi:hypothetical protein
MNRNFYERGTVPVNEQKVLRAWHCASQLTETSTSVTLCQSMNRNFYERGTVPFNENPAANVTSRLSKSSVSSKWNITSESTT